ncbi:(5-formylfuran-3-yl)methyl phosphate synthase [Aquabacter sp. L1I39]|uniref:(5-formylfuran-3-yl)methyl phosphate synthase n=1 Tax=Aquabacter sp. L1I39 TaxID=2820278 RepID=UPI001ADCA89F|nr:(5-formylfuran-3-yl)methyl phosphate synthase [Aquabacter sp. L1I39]QTL05929.1 (5-formylfuran-3-yl)methyl phosphate synthase [Aquabacter sp. L1I39]
MISLHDPAGRPGLLASVASLAELNRAYAVGADILDLKDPSAGALGAWAPQALTEAVKRWRMWPHPRPLLSATIGDHPLDPAILCAATARTAATGVPLVKIGFSRTGEDAAALPACLDALAPLARETRLIAVLFADEGPATDLVPLVAGAGFHGVMLDTARKDGRRLTDHLNVSALTTFVAAARLHGLLTGLAGSLRLTDIPVLAPLRPDYLGFRGALCTGSRTGALDPAALAAVRRDVAEVARSRENA